jgi:hypothetical protein
LFAGSGGVTLAELQQQLDALHHGQPIPQFGTPAGTGGHQESRGSHRSIQA